MKRTAIVTAEADQENKESAFFQDKPQLHSDSIPRVELPNTKYTDNPVELPGTAIQASEMPSPESAGAELETPKAHPRFTIKRKSIRRP
jgi:hypothetical protein